MIARTSSWIAACAAMFLVCATITMAQESSFDCGRKYCRDMSSCAEAHYKFTVCRHRQLDADNDGIPCENICGDTLAMYTARLGAGAALTGGPSAAGFNQLQNSPAGNTGVAVAPGFACGTKRTCREMTSCDEAKFHLEKCGLAKLDGDGDGVPCNALCRSR